MSKKDSPALREEERRGSLLSESPVGKQREARLPWRTGKASLGIPGRADSLSRAHRKRNRRKRKPGVPRYAPARFVSGPTTKQ